MYRSIQQRATTISQFIHDTAANQIKSVKKKKNINYGKEQLEKNLFSLSPTWLHPHEEHLCHGWVIALTNK